MTDEQRAERDELVAGLLAACPRGMTGYELGRLVRRHLGRPLRTRGGGGEAASLVRLKAAGRVRCVEEPWPGVPGFRRVWYPA